MLSRFFLILSFTLLIFSCSKDKLIYEPSKNTDPYKLYKEGYAAFNQNDFFNASKKFSEAEVSFENIDLAAKSAIMNCFSLYGINFYSESLENIERFLKTYPSDKNVIYAEYLKAIIFFEQISDEKKDLKPLLNAKKQIEYYLKKYPDSDYALDLKFCKIVGTIHLNCNYNLKSQCIVLLHSLNQGDNVSLRVDEEPLQ